MTFAKLHYHHLKGSQSRRHDKTVVVGVNLGSYNPEVCGDKTHEANGKPM